jgi:16S rRNA (adenine1518-N6/adenine1519-N6)-dimethyltransferase
VSDAGKDPQNTPRSARALLAAHGLRPKKSWGQNFLEDRRAIARIADAAALAPEDTALEIGAGLGALTRALGERAGQVIAVERDPDLVAVLQAEFPAGGRVRIAAMDALAIDYAALVAEAGGGGAAGLRPLVVVGNLPYQITTPLLFRLLRAAGQGLVARAVLMVQKEVAERIAAGPGRKSYGRLSVMVQQVAEVKILFHVGAGAFLPPPQVTSTVFSLVPRARPLAPVRDAGMFAAVVRAAFAGRRKMLRRSLDTAFGAVVGEALVEAGIEGTRRPEELAVIEFGRLADALAARGAKAPEETEEAEARDDAGADADGEG